MTYFRSAIGQANHRFVAETLSKPCMVAGITFDDVPGFHASSDGDVIFHALCQAITSISHVPIISGVADELYDKEGITDSEVYLKEALKTLKEYRLTSISISLEGKRPDFTPSLEKMRQNIARVCNLKMEQVGITTLYGSGLNSVSVGEGVNCIAIITCSHA